MFKLITKSTIKSVNINCKFIKMYFSKKSRVYSKRSDNK